MSSSSNVPQDRDAVHFEVRRDGLDSFRVVAAPLPDTLGKDQVLLRIERFALTANNITYAVTGDMLDYWGFFPTEDGWGRIPAMGFGTVVRASHPRVVEGARYYGWFPMASHVVIEAQPTTGGTLIDSAHHRVKHAVIYRSYTPSDQDPLYGAERENQIVLLRGLFITSFLIDDFMSDNTFFDARSTIVTSASSKTSIALAWLLAKRRHGPVIGLTSSGNQGFVESLGCYDAVHTYDTIETISNDTPAVVVDMAGNGKVIHDLHYHFGDALKYSCAVGASHWQAQRAQKDLPGPESVLFFAPKQAGKRRAEWGPGGLDKRLGTAWAGFVEFSDGWLEILRGRGEADLSQAYSDVLAGRALPHQGHVLSLERQ